MPSVSVRFDRPVIDKDAPTVLTATLDSPQVVDVETPARVTVSGVTLSGTPVEAIVDAVVVEHVVDAFVVDDVTCSDPRVRVIVTATGAVLQVA